MLRASTFMAIALSVTALASAATPAAAVPSKVLGGVDPHIAGQLRPATGVLASQEASHVLAPPKIPTAPPKTSLGTAQVPVSKLPVGSSTMKQPQIPVSQLPPPPIPHPVDDICPFDPLKCPAKQPKKKDDDGKDHGPIVILTPPVAVPVPMPVPVTGPVHVATANSAGVTAQAGSAATPPSVASQCGAPDAIPALAAGIDELLPNAQLSNEDRTKVTELRQMIQDLATNGKLAAARNVEEVAMYYLGYQKIWLQCGLGTFAWAPVVYNDAVRTADQSK